MLVRLMIAELAFAVQVFAQSGPGSTIVAPPIETHTTTKHVSMFIGGTKMIHAGDPVQISDFSTSYWQSHYAGAGRVHP